MLLLRCVNLAGVKDWYQELQWILPYKGADPLFPPPPTSDSVRSEIEILRRLWLRLRPRHKVGQDHHFCRFVGSKPEDIPIRVTFRIENRTRDAWRELDRTTWHYHHLRRWSITVENLLPPRLQYQKPPYALPEALFGLSEKGRLMHGKGNNANEAVGPRLGGASVRECTFSGFMKCNPMVFHRHEGAVELRRALTWWNSQVASKGIKAAIRSVWDEMRRINDKRVFPIEEKFSEWRHEIRNLAAYIRGITSDNHKGNSYCGSKPTSLNEAVRMAHALMEQKAQARIERIAEGNKRKWESSQGGNNGSRGNMARDCKGKAIATGAMPRPTVDVVMIWSRKRGNTEGTIARRERIYKVRKLEVVLT
ncbi:hypothetical protein Tco_0759211 [Tanacetum coccineum]